jgi:separase
MKAAIDDCRFAMSKTTLVRCGLGLALDAVALASDCSALRWCGPCRWRGHAGAVAVPPRSALLAALDSSQLFVYFGHGGGEKFVPAGSLWARTTHTPASTPAALLMGCSSGRLTSTGHYEAAGVALAYLAADSPLVIANLWDVTDRDIDRFSSAVLQRWLHTTAPPRTDAASTSGSVPPGARRAEPANAASSLCGGTHDDVDMSAAVAAARDCCRLPHLIGAAPVCYGLPTRLQLGPTVRV